MTNGEKYTTAHDRAVAFRAYCDTHDRVCTGCPLDCNTKDLRDESLYAWLDLEAEEEKPLPCPFCGGKTIVRRNWNSTNQVVCNSQGCWYCSKCESTESETIAAHNRVAKAVTESEVK